jgi:hypothetical protein
MRHELASDLERSASDLPMGTNSIRASLRILARFCAISGLLLIPSRALGETNTPDTSAGAVAPSDTRTTSYEVEVILVGNLALDTELASVIEELLVARGVSVTQKQAAQLSATELWSTSADARVSAIRIWVTLPHAALARLWFSAPSLERYLFREVPLQRGFDSVAREQIAQIIQTSADALSRGHQGLSRSDAQRAWQAQREEFATSAAVVEGHVAIAKGHVAVKELGPTRRSLFPMLGVGVGLSRNSSALGGLFGPFAEVGVDYSHRTHVFGVHLAGEWHLKQIFSDERARLELQSRTGLLLLTFRDANPRHLGFSANLGAGVERTRVVPAVNARSNFVPKAPYSDIAYLLRLRIGAAPTLGPIAFQLGLRLDLSLSNTDYGIVINGDYTELFSLSQFRPGFELAVVLD